ncbi:AFL184Wp [Eremothecium gossypii ATCC 10895]|uniref:Inheritance of peroxisomes protein 1 n=1 Tax=Eremothecium gossypii (strain ATCC 10895 / CBS 109.51 / FGSC 9923 / NRRL Y-1056) TaxID=284811 RepID=INP1_EREGS|nr:AFL184Wp [Eremothecium gossypii ATCC 10895]Q755Q4.2 RecName: Full=Inheritance of peroxisomes protein 1 [Eremothecium gossypii ATCC 10895]AAS53190.2 AFL184Wp [Eremothecium gossypii ATCC 10895]AEY97500.1 FAFL184Wp [Eremothecium gossypii FDAG1]
MARPTNSAASDVIPPSSKTRMPKIKPFKTIRTTFLKKKNTIGNLVSKGTHSSQSGGHKDSYMGDVESLTLRSPQSRGSWVESIDSKKIHSLSNDRVTLFRYEHVRVTSYQSVRKKYRNSGDSRRGQERMESAVKGTDVLRRERASVIEPRGPLEIYQIITPISKEPSQKVTYLCLGRKEQIIKPILPKLRITMLTREGLQFSVLSFNPENSWKIEFLGALGDSAVPCNVILAFENAVKNICRYTSELNNDPIEEVGTEDDDDLEYLLYSDFAEDDDTGSDITLNREHSSEPSDLLNCSTTNEMINDAFRKAIEHIRHVGSMPLIEAHGVKSFSSQLKIDGEQVDPPPKASPRQRAVSVPVETRTWSKLSTHPVALSTWMDIEYDDIKE